MATARPDTTLSLRRTFEAPPEKVFRAFTEAEALKKWWIPNDGFSVPSAEVDLRVGGGYRLAMQSPKGDVHRLYGTYREIDPPTRLVYTWRWEATEMDFGETLVTVEFVPNGKSTEVRITHELFPDSNQRDRHSQGWNGCLDRLPAAL